MTDEPSKKRARSDENYIGIIGTDAAGNSVYYPNVIVNQILSYTPPPPKSYCKICNTALDENGCYKCSAFDNQMDFFRLTNKFIGEPIHSSDFCKGTVFKEPCCYFGMQRCIMIEQYLADVPYTYVKPDTFKTPKMPEYYTEQYTR